MVKTPKFDNMPVPEFNEKEQTEQIVSAMRKQTGAQQNIWKELFNRWEKTGKSGVGQLFTGHKTYGTTYKPGSGTGQGSARGNQLSVGNNLLVNTEPKKTTTGGA